MYASKFKQKKFTWGGRAAVARFPAHGLVSVAGSIGGGSRLSGSEELADLHAHMLLEGTRSRTKKEIQIALDDLGASLSFDASDDRLAFSGRVRTKYLERFVALLGDLLTEPSFPEAELAILKKREEATLALRSQDTKAQAEIGLARLMFPPKHPNYAESVEESQRSLRQVTARALKSFHQRLGGGNTLVISIVGDVEPAGAFAAAEALGARLPRRAVSLPAFAAAAPARAKRAVKKVEHKASIDYLVGIPTRITYGHRDFPALALGVQILGNPGFTGRLMQIVREQESLTYTSYAFTPGHAKKADGFVKIWSSFAPPNFKKGRAAVMREVRRLVSEGASDIEVARHAKRFEAASSVQLTTTGALARAAHATLADGRPLNDLDAFPKRVAKLTAKAINKALKKYLRPDLLSESAAGPIQSLDLDKRHKNL